MKTLKYRLVLQVSVNPNGENPIDIQHRLEQIVKDAASNGTLTGNSPATVGNYKYYVESVKPKKVKRNRTFSVINDNDGNDTFEVSAKSADAAAHEALTQLGWWVAKP
jgi:hypothetical protein